jgi:hypothetical protein
MIKILIWYGSIVILIIDICDGIKVLIMHVMIGPFLHICLGTMYYIYIQGVLDVFTS